jgi:hypothetical protein
MNTAERVQVLAEHFQGRQLGFKSEADFFSLLVGELGHVMALDQPVPLSGGVLMQALAPRSIYHVCASNLDVSAEMSLLLSLILGSESFFKIPTVGLSGFEKRAMQAGEAVGIAVKLSREHEPQRLRESEAVVVFGSDETVERIRRQTTAKQRFLVYGHRVSVGLVFPGTASKALAEQAAREIIAYEQAGCLSPQAYLCLDFAEAEVFAGLLAEALEEKEKEEPSAQKSFEEESLHFAARQQALLRGNRIWGRAEQSPWTVVLRQDGFWEPGPGLRFIQVVPGSDWKSILWPWRGKLSSLSVSDLDQVKEWRQEIGELGFSRVCALGKLQEPSFFWRHDGRPRLADLVRWMTWE